jgi:hypothetical protein
MGSSSVINFGLIEVYSDHLGQDINKLHLLTLRTVALIIMILCPLKNSEELLVNKANNGKLPEVKSKVNNQYVPNKKT